MTWIIAQLARLLAPPRIVAVTRRPAGWWAVAAGDRLADVIAWGQLSDGEVVGLIARRRGLGIARGRGFLPAVPLGGDDAVQPKPPDGVSFAPADLVAAIGTGEFDAAHRAKIEARLRLAVDDGAWARQAYVSYIENPALFLARHLNRVVEHRHAAVLGADERAFFDDLVPVHPVIHAEEAPT